MNNEPGPATSAGVESATSNEATTGPPGAERAIVLFAMVFPTAAAAIYFLWLESSPSAPSVYSLSKVVQFSLPFLALALWRRRRARSASLWRRPATANWSAGRRLLSGLLSGTIAAAFVAGAYAAAANGLLATGVGHEVAAKTADFGIDSRARFAAMALFYSLAHSFLEELYWRGFVFAALDRWLGEKRALVLSALAFTSHHVVIVGRFAVSASGGVEAGGLVAFGSLSVLLGGVAWAWLYSRTGSLMAPWISHAIVDLAIMAVGYHLLWG